MSLTHLIKDNAQYMQESGFEPRTPHIFILKVNSLATRLIDQKKQLRLRKCAKTRRKKTIHIGGFLLKKLMLNLFILCIIHVSE